MAKKVRVMETNYVDELLDYRGRDVATPRLVINRVSKTISVDTHFPGDARTFAEERGDIIVFDIPLLRGETADKLMHECAQKARILCDSDSDSVEFEDAMSAIASIIDGYDADLEFWFAEDWFNDTNARLAEALGVTANTTDEEILDLCKNEELSAEGRIVGVEEYVESIREKLRAEQE